MMDNHTTACSSMKMMLHDRYPTPMLSSREYAARNVESRKLVC